MAETLVIRLPEGDSGIAECLLVDPGGAPLGEVAIGPLDAAAELSNGRRVIGLVPASCVLRTRADIPLRNKAKIQQALPFALEEQLAADVDDQHFAFGGRDADGKIPVAVVAQETVVEWLERFGTAGIRPDALYAESDALTIVPSTITVLVDGTRVIIRESDGNTTIADQDSLQAILELIIEEEPEHQGNTDDTAGESPADPDSETDSVPVNILIYCTEADYDRHVILWDMLRLRVDSLDVRILPDGALPRLASQISTQAGVNLLQGNYAPKRELPVDIEKWRVPGLLAGGLIALLLLGAGIDLWQLNREEQALDNAATELLRSTFPDTGAVNDPWAQLRAKLGDQGAVAPTAGPGFAEALAALAGAMTATPDISLEALGYRDGNLDLQLIAPSVDKLDRLRQGVVADGELSAEIQSANPDGDTIKGRMKISVSATQELTR